MGILDSIVEWIATQVMNLLDLITGSVLGALSLRNAFVPEFLHMDVRYRRGRRCGIAVGCHEQRPQ